MLNTMYWLKDLKRYSIHVISTRRGEKEYLKQPTDNFPLNKVRNQTTDSESSNVKQ